jgi:hypothetical protein
MGCLGFVGFGHGLCSILSKIARSKPVPVARESDPARSFQNGQIGYNFKVIGCISEIMCSFQSNCRRFQESVVRQSRSGLPPDVLPTTPQWALVIEIFDLNSNNVLLYIIGNLYNLYLLLASNDHQNLGNSDQFEYVAHGSNIRRVSFTLISALQIKSLSA